MYVCARQNEDKESLVSYASQVRGSAARRLTPEFSAKEDLSAVYHSVFLLSLSLSLYVYMYFSLSLSFSILPSSLLPLSFFVHASVFALGGSYPLYTATRLKVRNWPVRYIAWVLSFCGAIEITVI